MSAKEKFLFDNSFEGPLPAVGEAAPPPPPPEPEESEPAISEEDLAQAREAGRQEGIAIGREEGRSEAFAGIEQTTQNLLVGLTGHLGELLAVQPQMREEVAREALETAISVLTKLLPSVEKAAALKEIEAVVSECLERAKEEPRLVVRVSERMLEPVKSRVDALSASEGFEGKIVFLAADGFGDSDVRVEWADGGAERSLEETWRDIDEILARYLKVPAESLRKQPAVAEPPAAAMTAPPTAAAPTAQRLEADGPGEVAPEAPPLVSPLTQMGLSADADSATAVQSGATDNNPPAMEAAEANKTPVQPVPDAAGLQASPQELKHD